MKTALRTPLAAAAVALALGVAGAEARSLRTLDAGGGLYVQQMFGRALVHEASGEVSELALPPGALLSRLDRTADGWIAAGTLESLGTTDLFLLRSEDGERSVLPGPPNASGAPLRHEPVPLIEGGQLIGIAWIEGASVRRGAVWASLWSGADWAPAELVSPVGPGTQIGLAGAVLADGSWLLAWSAWDGNDDEIVWSRRLDQRWSVAQPLHRANEHPDIVPSVLAAGSGALAAWSSSDGKTYRVRAARFEDGAWRELPLIGPAATLRPRLTPSPAGAQLLYRTVVPRANWTLVELDERGTPLRRAVVAAETLFRPGLVPRPDGPPEFQWPGADITMPETTTPEWQPRPWPPPAGRQPPPPPVIPTADARLVAIGDSITAGSSWPSGCGNCPVVFDCTGGCKATEAKRDVCGYPRRLDEWLGAGYYVRNEGVGGQDTGEALAAFASEMTENCGTPGDCLAVTLMHGTNDMGGSTSPETARDNLAAIIAEARSRNIDVLLMSIVRRVYHWQDPKWQDYRDLVAALAGTENLQFVDSHASLCNNNWKCYNTNYYINGDTDGDGIDNLNEGPNDCTAPGEGDNQNGKLGHLDPDGYNVLTGLIQNVFPASVPAAPAPTAPVGDITEDTPDFVWPEVSTARWYELELDGATTWWEAALHCAAGTCTVNPGNPLADGAHSWRVRGRNLRGMGSWSADTAFAVVMNPPAAPVPIAPSGEIFEMAPTYRWRAVDGAEQYEIQVTGLTPVVVAAADACAGGLCSWVEGTVLTPGAYTLTLVAINGAGQSPPSSPGLSFTVLACSDPSSKNLATLEPSPVTAAKTVKHCGRVVAAESASYVIEATGSLTIHTRDGFTAHDGFTVRGGLTVKSP